MSYLFNKTPTTYGITSQQLLTIAQLLLSEADLVADYQQLTPAQFQQKYLAPTSCLVHQLHTSVPKVRLTETFANFPKLRSYQAKVSYMKPNKPPRFSYFHDQYDLQRVVTIDREQGILVQSIPVVADQMQEQLQTLAQQRNLPVGSYASDWERINNRHPQAVVPMGYAVSMAGRYPRASMPEAKWKLLEDLYPEKAAPWLEEVDLDHVFMYGYLTPCSPSTLGYYHQAVLYLVISQLLAVLTSQAPSLTTLQGASQVYDWGLEKLRAQVTTPVQPKVTSIAATVSFDQVMMQDLPRLEAKLHPAEFDAWREFFDWQFAQVITAGDELASYLTDCLLTLLGYRTSEFSIAQVTSVGNLSLPTTGVETHYRQNFPVENIVPLDEDYIHARGHRLWTDYAEKQKLQQLIVEQLGLPPQLYQDFLYLVLDTCWYGQVNFATDQIVKEQLVNHHQVLTRVELALAQQGLTVESLVTKLLDLTQQHLLTPTESMSNAHIANQLAQQDSNKLTSKAKKVLQAGQLPLDQLTPHYHLMLDVFAEIPTKLLPNLASQVVAPEQELPETLRLTYILSNDSQYQGWLLLPPQVTVEQLWQQLQPLDRAELKLLVYGRSPRWASPDYFTTFNACEHLHYVLKSRTMDYQQRVQESKAYTMVTMSLLDHLPEKAHVQLSYFNLADYLATQDLTASQLRSQLAWLPETAWQHANSHEFDVMVDVHPTWCNWYQHQYEEDLSKFQRIYRIMRGKERKALQQRKLCRQYFNLVGRGGSSLELNNVAMVRGMYAQGFSSYITNVPLRSFDVTYMGQYYDLFVQRNRWLASQGIGMVTAGLTGFEMSKLLLHVSCSLLNAQHCYFEPVVGTCYEFTNKELTTFVQQELIYTPKLQFDPSLYAPAGSGFDPNYHRAVYRVEPSHFSNLDLSKQTFEPLELKVLDPEITCYFIDDGDGLFRPEYRSRLARKYDYFNFTLQNQAAVTALQELIATLPTKAGSKPKKAKKVKKARKKTDFSVIEQIRTSLAKLTGDYPWYWW